MSLLDADALGNTALLVLGDPANAVSPGRVGTSMATQINNSVGISPTSESARKRHLAARSCWL